MSIEEEEGQKQVSFQGNQIQQDLGILSQINTQNEPQNDYNNEEEQRPLQVQVNE